jgi:AraC-like DNA-binding protein
MSINIIIIFAGLLGYILVFITLKNSRYNIILNSFLLFIIFISSTLKLIAGIGEIYNDIYFKTLYIKIHIYITLFIPSFYLYFKYLIRNQKQFIIKDLLHLIFLLFAIIEREFLILDRIVGFKIHYYFSQFVAIYSLVYLLMIYLLLKKNVWNKTATLTFVNTQNNLIKKWTIILFSIIIAFIFRFHVVYYKEYLFLEPSVIDLTLKYLWVVSCVWIVLFIIILSNPAILYGFSYLQVETTSIDSDSISNNYWNANSKIKIKNNQDQLLKEKISSKIEQYLFELNTILYKNSYFNNPEFSMKDLAQVLNIPISHLKFVFKYHSKLSFSDYKKISRIQNSLKLINNNYLATNTLESLSKEVGFTSYNPFFTCFKEVIGKSPHEYISTIKSNLDKYKSVES